MLDITRLYFFIFGALTIAGGVMGYAKGSQASLIAGGISGILILVAAFLLKTNMVVGLVLGGVVALALAGRFFPAFLSTGKWMPAGMMAILSAIAVVLVVASFIKR